MALPTANLPVSQICSTLGVNSPKEIFYNGATLKTISELGALVSKNGLDPTYCPGADTDARLANLLSDRRLSYFKGYLHIVKVSVYERGVGAGNWANDYEYTTGLITVSEQADYIRVLKSASGWDSVRVRTDWVLDTSDRDLIASYGLKLNIVYSIVSGSGTLSTFKFTLCSSSSSYSSTGFVDLSGTISIVPEDTETSSQVCQAFASYPCFFMETGDNATVFEIRIHEIYYE